MFRDENLRQVPDTWPPRAFGLCKNLFSFCRHSQGFVLGWLGPGGVPSPRGGSSGPERPPEAAEPEGQAQRCEMFHVPGRNTKRTHTFPPPSVQETAAPEDRSLLPHHAPLFSFIHLFIHACQHAAIQTHKHLWPASTVLGRPGLACRQPRMLPEALGHSGSIPWY